VLDKKLAVDPKNTYSTADEVSFLTVLTNITEDLWKGGRVEVLINGLREVNPSKKAFSLVLNNIPYKKILGLSLSIPAKELSSDYYEIKLTLMDKDNKPIDEKKNEFHRFANRTYHSSHR
jgi:hypothetical protein